jgi:alkylation response protein AidB-like acyl-CoA dehydrogenase
MHFELSEEHKAVQQAAREFAQNVLKAGVIDRDEHQKFPAEEVKQLGELGFM